MWRLKVYHCSKVLENSDYSQQEPRMASLLALSAVDNDINKAPMVQGFIKGQDVYATVASLAFGVPYEQCLEFNPTTGEYQPDGKQRRTECKSVVLGINYGRSVNTIGEQLFGDREDMTDEDRTKAAQVIYDKVLTAFPDLKLAINYAQASAKARGYTETILGRRRHIPDMMLPPYDFVPENKYVNPDVDPLDPNTLKDANKIPDRIQQSLREEFSKYKYRGQVFRRIRELHEKDHIKVIDNNRKITDASRQCFNSSVQGSAADMTKLALLNINNSKEWKRIGGKIVDVIHDEVMGEVPYNRRKEGEKLLADCMVRAADFMPFTIKCDVEDNFRWYGNSVDDIESFKKPDSFDSLDDEGRKWIQIRLLEMEYTLPVLKNDDGTKPIGVAAHGVNGVETPEFLQACDDYMKTRKISQDKFFDYLDYEVEHGCLPKSN